MGMLKNTAFLYFNIVLKLYYFKLDFIFYKKQTSKKIATKASKLLKSKASSKRVKSVAGSALSQTKTSRKKQ